MNRNVWLFTLTLIILCLKELYSSRVTHDVAMDMCIGRGLLAPHHDFQTIPGTVYVRENEALKGTYSDVDVELADGESAWVSGFVHMSTHYLAWYGCKYMRTSPNNITKVKLENNSLYHCLHECSNHSSVNMQNDFFMIGLQQKKCYCISRQQFDILVDDQECDIYGKWTKSIAVFQFWSQTTLTINNTNYGQCIIVKRDERGMHYRSEDCLREYKAICIDYNSNAKINGTCPVIFGVDAKENTDTMCKLTQQSTWLESRQVCQYMSGKIMPYVYSYTEEHFDFLADFWVGVFRSLRFVDQKHEAGPLICLSVTRIRSQLFLQPHNCTDKLKYICRDDDETIGNSKSKTQPGSVTVIVIATVALFVLVTIVTLAVLIRKRNGTNIRRASRLFNSESEHDNAETALHCSEKDNPISPVVNSVAEKHLDALENSHPKPPEESNEKDQPTPKFRPEKPMRNTLRRQKEQQLLQGTTYENFTLKKSKVVDETKPAVTANKDNANDEYDKIDLSKHKQSVSVQIEDVHVYDHAITSTGDDYDTARSVKYKRDHDVGSSETYSKINLKESVIDSSKHTSKSEQSEKATEAKDDCSTIEFSVGGKLNEKTEEGPCQNLIDLNVPAANSNEALLDNSNIC